MTHEDGGKRGRTIEDVSDTSQLQEAHIVSDINDKKNYNPGQGMEINFDLLISDISKEVIEGNATHGSGEPNG